MRDGNLNRLLGLHSADTTQPFAKFLTHIHPDDRATVQAAFDASARDGRPLGVEFRVVWPDGAVRWLRDQGDVFGGAAAGRHMAGACVDVTERREAEEALRASEERLRLIVASATDYAILTLAPDRTVTSWSPGAEAIFGYAEGEVLGRSGDILYTSEDRAAGVPQEEARTAIREGRAADERWHVGRNGTRFYASGVMTPLGAGGARGFVKVASDLTGRKRMEDALARDARILASVHDAVVVTDLGGVVTYWNEGAARLFGWPADELVGRHYADRFPEPERAWIAAEIAKLAGGSEWVGEHEDLRKDGSRVWIDARVARFDGPDGRPAGILGVSRDITARKRAEDKLRRARDELEDRVSERTAELARANAALREGLIARQELLQKLSTAQEDERRRVSRELHDGLGQELTALILGLKALERAVPEDAPGRDRLLEVERIVNRIGREAHDLAVELRPTALDDLGLGPALSAYSARWSERTGVAAEFQPLGLDGGRLPQEVETAVYRVVQEALNNVAKHAGARRVSVMVARQDGELVTLIEDDGRGFDPERAGAGSGRRSLGLLGMRERVGLVGGTLVIESGEGEGAVVQARIPLAQHPGEDGHGG
jgi:PAS domain S-box-containing protein